MNIKNICGYLYQGNIYNLDCQLEKAEPIERDSVIGKRMQERTLHLLFIAVMKELYPNVNVRIEHSFSQGVYIKLDDFENVCLDNVITKMKHYIDLKTPIIQKANYQFALLETSVELYDMVCKDCGGLTFNIKPYQQGLWLSLQDEFVESN